MQAKLPPETKRVKGMQGDVIGGKNHMGHLTYKFS